MLRVRARETKLIFMNPIVTSARILRPVRAAIVLWGIIIGLSCPAATPRPVGALSPLAASQHRGTLQINRSASEKPLQIGERTFALGLGTHAPSRITYELGGSVERFEAWVGVDAARPKEEEEDAAVIFKVLGDERELFNSGVMKAETPARRVSVPLAGVNELTLVVTDAGDRADPDHADWADAVILGDPKPECRPPRRPARFQVRTDRLTLQLSADGGIVGAVLGPRGIKSALQGGTVLVGCTNAGPIVVRKRPDHGVEFARRVVQAVSGHAATVTDRYIPSNDSLRWETEIAGEGAPWSTAIETRLYWPASGTTRFWTAWEDPQQQRQTWDDPLELQPLRDARWWYGAPRWDEENRMPRYPLTRGDGFVIPLATLVEPETDTGLTAVLSPDDVLLDLALTTHRDGACVFSRQSHRLSGTNVVRFTLDLVSHAADWRGGLGWMTRRYAAYFNPPNPRAHDIAGLGAYSDWEGELDFSLLRRMGFRLNWKASYDFPYMGMFLPPIPDDEKYDRLVKSNQTSIVQLRDYSRRMKAAGLQVLNYFNVTEFGATNGMPSEPDPAIAPADRWRNVHNFLRDEVGDGLLLDLHGLRFRSWEGSVGMDCGAPMYRAFLLDQARRHIDKLPDSAGICIDRLDWLRGYNFRADDGQSWRQERPARSLYVSWRNLLAEMGPMFHAAGKVIFVNAMINRTELLRHVDGIYHEFGHEPPDLNGAALQCLRKPCVAWTPNENALNPDPDAFLQRQLYLGVYPTAPLPANDHTICAGTWADRFYLDYGPLFDTLRGRRWLLAPHAFAIEGGTAKANLFEVPAGWLIPVILGQMSARVILYPEKLGTRFRGGKMPSCEALYPAETTWIPVPARLEAGRLVMDVPLHRGCAVIRVTPVRVDHPAKHD